MNTPVTTYGPPTWLGMEAIMLAAVSIIGTNAVWNLVAAWTAPVRRRLRRRIRLALARRRLRYRAGSPPAGPAAATRLISTVAVLSLSAGDGSARHPRAGQTRIRHTSCLAAPVPGTNRQNVPGTGKHPDPEQTPARLHGSGHQTANPSLGSEARVADSGEPPHGVRSGSPQPQPRCAYEEAA